jgi:PPE-repeat protein
LDAVALYIASIGTGSLALSITNTTRPWFQNYCCNRDGLNPTQGGTAGWTNGESGAEPGPLAGAAPVSAGIGQASSVGTLSVPHSWTTAAPEIQLAVDALPSAAPGAESTVPGGGPTGLLSGMALGSLAARMGGGSNSTRNTGTAAPAKDERKPTVVVIQKPPPPPGAPLP